MKIVFLNIYQGLANRGAERSTLELCRRLSLQNKITLISGGKPENISNVKNLKIPVLFPRIPDTSSSFFRRFYLDIWSLQIFLFTLFALPFLLKQNIDILIPVNGGWQTFLCKLVSVIKKSKLTIIGRAGIGRDDHFNLLFRPDLFIALTKKAFSWAKKINPEGRIVHLPNGVDLEKFNPRVKPKALNLTRPIILAVSALTENKRLDLTIKAVALMKKPASLLIIGQGPLQNKLQKEGLRLLGEKRFLIAKALLSEMPGFYTAADVFTLVPVEEEAFGNVFLEALASNLPVVAPNDSIRREVLETAAVFCRPENSSQYAAALDRALSIDFGSALRRQAEKYSWSKVIKGYQQTFIQLIEKNE